MKFERFFRYFGMILLVFILNACGSSSSRPQILFSEFSEGMPQEKLILMDLEGEIIEDFNIGDIGPRNFSIEEGKYTFIDLGDGKYTIYNAVEQEFIEVKLADEFIGKVHPGFWGFINTGGDRWSILSSPTGVPVLLVNLESGRTEDLTGLDDNLMFFNGNFSPNEDYIFVIGSKNMIIPTDSINQAREFEKSIFGGFSSDNETFVYVNAENWQLIVEDVDGSNSEVVAEYGSYFEARFVPGKDEILIFLSVKDQGTTLLLISLANGSEEEIGEFDDGRPNPQVFSPSGENLLITNIYDEWVIVDLKNNGLKKLDALDNYTLRSSPGLRNDPGWKWVILGKDCAAACPEYVSLNLETGKVRKIIEFDEDVYMNRVISQSQDGQVVLLYSYNGDQTELWLYDAQKNETILLDKADGLGGGSLSFDGKWVVWQVFERKGDVANSEIWLMNIGDMEKKNLGPGMRPILVQP